MLDYLQRPKPEGKEDYFTSIATKEPLNIRLAKIKGNIIAPPSKNKGSMTSLS